MTWDDLLSRWRLIENDLHQEYGIDVGDPVLMRARSWRWLEARIVGLLSTECRLSRALAPDPDGPNLPSGRR